MSGTKKYYEVFEKELHTEKALTGWSNNLDDSVTFIQRDETS